MPARAQGRRRQRDETRASARREIGGPHNAHSTRHTAPHAAQHQLDAKPKSNGRARSARPGQWSRWIIQAGPRPRRPHTADGGRRARGAPRPPKRHRAPSAGARTNSVGGEHPQKADCTQAHRGALPRHPPRPALLSPCRGEERRGRGRRRSRGAADPKKNGPIGGLPSDFFIAWPTQSSPPSRALLLACSSGHHSSSYAYTPCQACVERRAEPRQSARSRRRS